MNIIYMILLAFPTNVSIFMYKSPQDVCESRAFILKQEPGIIASMNLLQIVETEKEIHLIPSICFKDGEKWEVMSIDDSSTDTPENEE